MTLPSRPARAGENSDRKDSAVASKLRLLEEMGQGELAAIFRDFKGPRRSRRKPSAPLDQRVAITVTSREKFLLVKELDQLKSAGEKISTSQFIRNRALGSVDIQGWAEIARNALIELAEIANSESSLREERDNLLLDIENTEDEEEIGMAQIKISEIDFKLGRLIAQNEKRVVRLTGRMSFRESEMVKWRAERLCISASDYLRMMIFALEPSSRADSHMSLDAKRRFYVSIVDVANNGWGTAPNVHECSECAVHMEENSKLRDRIRELEGF